MARWLRFLAIVGAVFAFAWLFFGRDGNDIGKFNFPQRTETGVQLPSSKTGESRKVIEYQADKRTPRVTVVELTNGNTVYTHHRPDGSAEKTEEFYPAAGTDKPGERQLRARANLGADGKTYTSDLALRPDNTREREGIRLADGGYDITFYHPDGLKVQKHQIVSADRKPLLEEVFAADGTPVSKAVLNPGGSFELTHFTDKGKRASVSVKTNRYHEELTFFRADGETPQTRVINDMFSTQVTQILPDGNVEQVRLFTYEGMEVVIYRNGVPHHRQKWDLRNPSEKDVTKLDYRLKEVATVNAKSKPTQTIELSDDQVTPARIVTPENPEESNGLRKIKSFRPDGTVEKEVVRKGDYGDITSTTVFPEGTRHEIDPTLLAPVPYTTPTRPVPPPVPQGPF